VGVELSREAYEAGEWAGAVEEAWMKGRDRKRVRSELSAAGGARRSQEGKEMARKVVEWVEKWRRPE
jgi:hypothetical protein